MIPLVLRASDVVCLKRPPVECWDDVPGPLIDHQAEIEFFG